MISTQRYFIHIENGSIVPWTSEIEDNYKFKEISLKIAMAVEHGKISAQEVIDQITRQIKPATLEQMLDAKLKMNVREGHLNLEAQVKEDNTQKDTGDAKPYDVQIPDGGATGEETPPPPEPTAKEAGGKKSGGKKNAPPPPEPTAKEAGGKKSGGKKNAPPPPENAEEAPADDAAADKVAEILDGGVNV